MAETRLSYLSRNQHKHAHVHVQIVQRRAKVEHARFTFVTNALSRRMRFPYAFSSDPPGFSCLDTSPSFQPFAF